MYYLLKMLVGFILLNLLSISFGDYAYCEPITDIYPPEWYLFVYLFDFLFHCLVLSVSTEAFCAHSPDQIGPPCPRYPGS